MMPSRKRFVWALAACAAVVVQAAPVGVCRACDKPCCAGLRPTVTGSVEEPGHTCPLCAAASGRDARGGDDQPCRCRLDARDEQPLSLPRGGVSPADAAGPAVGMVADLPDVPHAIGVCPEYAAALLAMPIRPPRILFGVWRN